MRAPGTFLHVVRPRHLDGESFQVGLSTHETVVMCAEVCRDPDDRPEIGGQQFIGQTLSRAQLVSIISTLQAALLEDK